MKKVFTLLSSLLIFAGLKAQTVTPPAVKKETVKPGAIQPGVVTDTIKKIAMKENSKAIKFDHIKKTPTVQMKETPVQMKETPVAKPHKG
jgi:hypothetical protein